MYGQVIVHRTKGVSWIFNWDKDLNGFVCHTKKNIYKIFHPSEHKGFWIGVLMKDIDTGEEFWVTWEKQISATQIDFENGSFFFNKKG